MRQVKCHGEGIWLPGHLLPLSICVEALVEPPLWHPVCDGSTLQVFSLLLLSEEYFLWGGISLSLFPPAFLQK